MKSLLLVSGLLVGAWMFDSDVGPKILKASDEDKQEEIQIVFPGGPFEPDSLYVCGLYKGAFVCLTPAQIAEDEAAGKQAQGAEDI